MHMEMKQELWWVQSLMKVSVVIFYKVATRMTCMHLHTSEAIQTVLVLNSKYLDLEDIIYLMDF